MGDDGDDELPYNDGLENVTNSSAISFVSIVDSFADFLHVAIHTILYERQIYPSSLFLPARKYNHPVRQARHPKLCRWIQDAVDACTVQVLRVRREDYNINLANVTNI